MTCGRPLPSVVRQRRLLMWQGSDAARLVGFKTRQQQHSSATTLGHHPMLGIHDFWLFFVSALLLNVAPGPDTAYVVARSLQMGWRGGVAATFSVTSGGLVHVYGGALGLSALLAASATAFTSVKWLGAAYLAYVGITMLLSRQGAPTPDSEVVHPT